MIPENEMGVIILFAQTIIDKPIEIVRIGGDFPDVIIRFADKEYRAEFEFMAKNFIKHNHDVRKCDLVICWKNDAPNDFILPVWELSRPDWFTIDRISLPTLEQREITYWRQRALRAERKLKMLQDTFLSADEERSGLNEKSKNFRRFREIPRWNNLLAVIENCSGEQTFVQSDVQEWTGLKKTAVYALLNYGEYVHRIKRIDRGTYICSNGTETNELERVEEQ